MLDQATEKLELGRAVGTMVYTLLMHRTLQVPVEIWKTSELPGAEIAFETMAIPGSTCGPGIDSSIRVRICQEALCNEVVRIPGTDFVVDRLTSNA